MKLPVLVAVGSMLIGLTVGTTIYIDDSNKPNRGNLSLWMVSGVYVESLIDMDLHCSFDHSTELYPNHTISNGELKRVCSLGHYPERASLFFEIEAFGDGYLVLDIPKDEFLPEDYFEVHVNHFGGDGTTRLYLDDDFIRHSLDLNKELTESVFLKRAWGVDSSNRHLQVTKAGSFDDFDRYRIPFLKDDVVFRLVPVQFSHLVPSLDDLAIDEAIKSASNYQCDKMWAVSPQEDLACIY